MKEGVFETAEDQDWVKAEWYVLIPLAALFHTELGSNYISDLEWVLESS